MCPLHFWEVGLVFIPRMSNKGPLLERFTNQIKLAETPVQSGPMAGTYCWLWTGAKEIKAGYGVVLEDICIAKGKQLKAHRASYMLFIGEIPGDLTVDHQCRNVACVNPNHLRLLTRSENSDGGWVRKNRTATHCPRGHEYTPENTYVRHLKSGNKGRNCKECKRIVSLAQYYKRRAKLVLSQLPIPE